MKYQVSALCLGIVCFARGPADAEQRESSQLVRQKQRRGEQRGEIHLALAGLLARDGDGKTKVFKHLRAARKLGVEGSRVDLVAGTFYRRQGRYDAACATFLRVLVQHPGQPHALVQLWKALYEIRLRGASVNVDLKAIRDRLANYGLHFPDEYRKEKNAAFRSRKLTIDGYSALLGQRDRFAAGLFRGAIDIMPSNARAHRGLGIARARRKDYLRAAGAYLLYLELNPNAPDAASIDAMLARYWRNMSR